jgi:hypothetical protein
MKPDEKIVKHNHNIFKEKYEPDHVIMSSTGLRQSRVDSVRSICDQTNAVTMIRCWEKDL